MSTHTTLTTVLITSIITTGTIGIIYSMKGIATDQTQITVPPVASRSATPSASPVQPTISPTIKQATSSSLTVPSNQSNEICRQQATATARVTSSRLMTSCGE